MASASPTTVDVELRLGEVRVLNVRAGDVVVVTPPPEYSSVEDLEAFGASTERALRKAGVPESVEILVAPPGTSLDVVRGEEQA